MFFECDDPSIRNESFFGFIFINTNNLINFGELLHYVYDTHTRKAEN